MLAFYGWSRRLSLDQSVPVRAPTTRLQLGGFLAANAIALALVAVAVSQPWVGELGDVPRSLATRWLPAALAIATALAAAIGWHLEPSARAGFFARHLALYLAARALDAALLVELAARAQRSGAQEWMDALFISPLGSASPREARTSSLAGRRARLLAELPALARSAGREAA